MASNQEATNGIELDISEKEEEGFLNENLDHIDKFLANLQLRDKPIPRTAFQKLQDLKKKWSPFFIVNDRDSQALRNEPMSRKPRKPVRVTDRSTGAISKTSTRADTEHPQSSDTPTPSSESESDPDIVLKTSHHRSLKAKHEDITQLNAVLKSAIDNRRASAFSKYNENTNMTLSAYFLKFEVHCEKTFKGDKNSWIAELENHLQGKTLEAFHSYYDENDDYDDIRAALLDWYDDVKVSRIERNMTFFKKAKPSANESMGLYAARLERMYKLAFP